jgi:hypothetical protein
MNTRITEITNMLRHLEDELELEFAKRRLALAYTVREGRVHFQEHVLQDHRRRRSRLLAYVLAARPLMLITAPVIYALVIPFALLDVWVSLYQHVCFPVYGMATVRRSAYVVFDRAHLAYLNPVERFNCLYCSYANGVIGYVREVASLTEQYWCPIKHARRILGAHGRYGAFADFGDAEAYQSELVRLREALRRRDA